MNLNAAILNMDSERIPRSLLRGLASELPKIIGYLAWKIPCTLVQGASIPSHSQKRDEPGALMHRPHRFNEFPVRKWCISMGQRPRTASTPPGVPLITSG